MILYVNGDSHAAAAEAVNAHAFADDDPALNYLGRLPHPDNLAVSWGRRLSLVLKYGFQCDAESASSNTRILRTTREWLASGRFDTSRLLVIVQWSTWEREEWLHDGVSYQVGASGLDHLPAELEQRYRNYVADVDWTQKTQQAHDEIWALHQELTEQGIRHVFFNGNNSFERIQDRRDWGCHYMGPYDPGQTFDSVIRAQGIETVAPNSWHFGQEGHDVWARHMLNYLIEHRLV